MSIVGKQSVKSLIIKSSKDNGVNKKKRRGRCTETICASATVLSKMQGSLMYCVGVDLTLIH